MNILDLVGVLNIIPFLFFFGSLVTHLNILFCVASYNICKKHFGSALYDIIRILNILNT
jgi:hypothetical protein